MYRTQVAKMSFEENFDLTAEASFDLVPGINKRALCPNWPIQKSSKL